MESCSVSTEPGRERAGRGRRRCAGRRRDPRPPRTGRRCFAEARQDLRPEVGRTLGDTTATLRTCCRDGIPPRSPCGAGQDAQQHQRAVAADATAQLRDRVVVRLLHRPPTWPNLPFGPTFPARKSRRAAETRPPVPVTAPAPGAVLRREGRAEREGGAIGRGPQRAARQQSVAGTAVERPESGATKASASNPRLSRACNVRARPTCSRGWITRRTRRRGRCAR